MQVKEDIEGESIFWRLIEYSSDCYILSNSKYIIMNQTQ